MDVGPSREGAFPQPGPRQARVTQRGPREARQQTTTGSTLSLKERDDGYVVTGVEDIRLGIMPPSIQVQQRLWPSAGVCTSLGLQQAAVGSRGIAVYCLSSLFTEQLQLSVCGDSRDGASCCATGETEP
ncbi:hypothetical protein MHYP_G00066190 [Metynnis hypsauchen]